MTKQITLQEIKKALAKDEFIFHYQPKVSMITGELIGGEALIRWKKSDGHIVQPSEFIPLAESSGFISEITKTMFHKLVIDMVIFEDVAGGLSISMNASTKDFKDRGFVDIVKKTIVSRQLNSNKIEVELTESSLLEESDIVDSNISSLAEMGIALTMDDFGTGFSSLDILSKYSFSSLKIDQGVVSRMEHSDKDRAIVESSIRMGHQLGIDVVAEGIESEKVYRMLQNFGCTIGQGYWISHPLSLSDFLSLAQEMKRWPSTPAGLIYMAQIDHIQWRKLLINSVFDIKASNDSFQLESKPPKCERSCMLGKWYYGAGKVFSGVPQFDDLEEPHSKLHDLGDELIDAAAKGATREELVSKMRELSRLSSLIIRLLQELENEIL